ncbi:MAG: hypothetical protein HKN12_00445, partial [Gemmatimonadetes bacterium]|nr:hypothetical protein [Gemmatimonadota bacterium]
MWPSRTRRARRGPGALAAGIVAVGVVTAGVLPAGATSPLPPDALREAQAGLDHLYHGRTGQARAAFERVRALQPASPAADFLLGGIEWHRLTTGPQGFTGGGATERDFFARMDAAIAVGEAAIERDGDDLAARFFVGGAYGY